MGQESNSNSGVPVWIWYIFFTVQTIQLVIFLTLMLKVIPRG